MVDLATALATKLLTPIGGREVTQVGVEIPGAGGGLHDALAFDAIELDIDDEVYVVLKVRCAKLRFDPIKDSDCMRRVHIMKPVDGSGGAFIPEEIVSDYMEGHQEMIRLKREEAANIQRLPFRGSGDDDDGDDGPRSYNNDDEDNPDAE